MGWIKTALAPELTPDGKRDTQALDEMKLVSEGLYKDKDGRNIYVMYWTYPFGAMSADSEHRGEQTVRDDGTMVDTRIYKTLYMGTDPRGFVAIKYFTDGIDANGNVLFKWERITVGDFCKLMGWTEGKLPCLGKLPDTTPVEPMPQDEQEPKRIARKRLIDKGKEIARKK